MIVAFLKRAIGVQKQRAHYPGLGMAVAEIDHRLECSRLYDGVIVEQHQISPARLSEGQVVIGGKTQHLAMLEQRDRWIAGADRLSAAIGAGVVNHDHFQIEIASGLENRGQAL